MYVEYKGHGLEGPARIGRVTYSKSGRTLHYGDRPFRSIKGGYKANYYDVETGEEYWISGCKRDGNDRLYPGHVEIDEDVREEYWLEIRNRPDLVEQRTYRCPGKYTKRSPG